jgi:hypothetical protein
MCGQVLSDFLVGGAAKWHKSEESHLQILSMGPGFSQYGSVCIILQELSGICFPCIFLCICWDFWQLVCTDFGIAKLFSHFHYTAFTDVNILSYDIQHVLIHQIGGCFQELLQFKGDHLVV